MIIAISNLKTFKVNGMCCLALPLRMANLSLLQITILKLVKKYGWSSDATLHHVIYMYTEGYVDEGSQSSTSW